MAQERWYTAAIDQDKLKAEQKAEEQLRQQWVEYFQQIKAYAPLIKTLEQIRQKEDFPTKLLQELNQGLQLNGQVYYPESMHGPVTALLKFNRRESHTRAEIFHEVSRGSWYGALLNHLEGQGAWTYRTYQKSSWQDDITGSYYPSEVEDKEYRNVPTVSEQLSIINSGGDLSQINDSFTDSVTAIVKNQRWVLTWQKEEGACFHGYPVLQNLSIYLGLTNDLNHFWISQGKRSVYANGAGYIETSQRKENRFLGILWDSKEEIVTNPLLEAEERITYRYSEIDEEALKSHLVEAARNPFLERIEHVVPPLPTNLMSWGGGGGWSNCGCSHGSCGYGCH